MNSETDLHRLVRHTATYGIAYTLPAVAGLVSVVILTNLVAPPIYGEFIFLSSAAAVLAVLGGQWIQQSILRYRSVATPAADSVVLRHQLLLLTVMLGAALTAVGVVVALGLVAAGRNAAYLYVVIALLTAAQIVFANMRAYYRAGFKARVFTTMSATYALFSVAAPVGFVLVFGPTVLSLITGALTAFVLALTPLSARVVRSEEAYERLRRAGRLDQTQRLSETAMKYFLFGAPLIGWFLGQQVLALVDRFALEFTRGSAALGVYTPSYNLGVQVIGLVASPILLAAHPLLMERSNVRAATTRELASLITRFARVFVLVVVPCVMYLLAVSHQLAHVLFGPQYRAGWAVIPIAALGQAGWSFSMYANKPLEMRERTRSLALAALLSSTVCVVATFPAAIAFGGIGVATAFAGSCWFHLVVTRLFANSAFRWAWPRRTFLLALVAGAPAVVASVAFNHLFSTVPSLLQVAFSGLLMCAVYPALLLAFHEITITNLRSALRAFTGMARQMPRHQELPRQVQ